MTSTNSTQRTQPCDRAKSLRGQDAIGCAERLVTPMDVLTHATFPTDYHLRGLRHLDCRMRVSVDRNLCDRKRSTRVLHAPGRHRSRWRKHPRNCAKRCHIDETRSQTLQTTTVAAQASVSRRDMSVVTAVRNVRTYSPTTTRRMLNRRCSSFAYSEEHCLLRLVQLSCTSSALLRTV